MVLLLLISPNCYMCKPQGFVSRLRGLQWERVPLKMYYSCLNRGDDVGKIQKYDYMNSGGYCEYTAGIWLHEIDWDIWRVKCRYVVT